MDDLKKFRALDSITPGHPESHLTPGVEVTSGPLGQGISNAVGMAIARAHLAAVFNRDQFEVIDHNIFVFAGDGCMMEGVASEASSLAGHLGLGSLIVLYDNNHITIDGKTDIAFSEDVMKRYEAYGWHTQTVANGDTDGASILQAIQTAKQVVDKPSIISVRTTIGYGSAMADTAKVHGSPLGPENIVALKKKLKMDPEASYSLSQRVIDVYGTARQRGMDAFKQWESMLAKYATTYPKEYAELTRRSAPGFKLPEGFDWNAVLPTYTPSDKAMATRKLSEICLNALAEPLPELVGGSADLTASNLTLLKCSHDFQKDTPDGRYVRFGVREHAMAAICNGLVAYGAIIPFSATFLTFIGYCAGAVRVSALSQSQVIYIMTHDSIGVGEDGPTHQPIETLMSLRHTPNTLVFRPADGKEVSGAYKAALLNTTRPSVLALTRQGLPHLEHTSIDGVLKGAYVIHDHAKPAAILVATGSEVPLCMDAVKLLQVPVRVVSMPTWELFEDQSEAYKLEIFPSGVPVISVEAGSTFAWSRYAHVHVGIDRFGMSAPAKQCFEVLGVTAAQVAEKTMKTIDFFKGKTVISRLELPR